MLIDLHSAAIAHWPRPPRQPTLAKSDLHVWRLRVDRARARVSEFQQLLDPEELERARRFVHPLDRDRFIVRRALLRTILGEYSRRPPAHLRFRVSPFGKPSLADDARQDQRAEHDLRFNLSHSHGLALLAVAPGREVGIDIERIRPEIVAEKLAERFFAPAEVAALRSLPDESQPAGFFNAWSRKEAYVKAVGRGLSLSLASFEVSLRPGEPARLLATLPDPRDAGRWSLRALDADPAYAAAVVIEGQESCLKCWELEP
ncbi:MAG: 4'-phosphopantetheinyl transferase superfamily protein [Planctomycetota bacterium]